MKYKIFKKYISLILLGTTLSLTSCTTEEELPSIVGNQIEETQNIEPDNIELPVIEESTPYVEPVRIGINPVEVDLDSLEYNTRLQDVIVAASDTPIYNINGEFITDFVAGRNYVYLDEDDDNYIIDYFGENGIVSKETTFLSSKRVVNQSMINKGCIKEVTSLYSNKELTEQISYLDKLEFVEIYREVNDTYLVQSRDEVGYIKKDAVELMEKDSAVIDINNQEMRVYEGNELKVYTPVVTGTKNTSRRSDEGLFNIRTKYSTKNGFDIQPGYKVMGVLYYNGGEGIHTANYWRKQYGGNIYLKNGSHGCINTPDDKFEELFKILGLGEYVLVYTKRK